MTEAAADEAVQALADPLAWLAARPAGDALQAAVLQGLARRAAAQPPGALREQLVARLLRRAAPPPPVSPTPPAGAATASRPRAALAALVAQLQTGGGELRNVQAHERTWSALRLTRRMAEVSAPVPEHLGPLNNRVLMTRALQQLGTLAPGYLQRLLAQLDTLAALAPLQAAAEAQAPLRGSMKKPAGKAPPRAATKAPTRPR